MDFSRIPFSDTTWKFPSVFHWKVLLSKSLNRLRDDSHCITQSINLRLTGWFFLHRQLLIQFWVKMLARICKCQDVIKLQRKDGIAVLLPVRHSGQVFCQIMQALSQLNCSVTQQWIPSPCLATDF